MISATACAKVILFGEHAVVYGEPAIAAPVSSLRASVTIEPTNQPLHIVAPDLDPNSSIAPSQINESLSKIIELVLEAANAPTPNAHMIIRSDIPIASGLGSGAAVSTAIARALSEFLNQPLETKQLKALVYEIEKIHHGTPSGIDNTVIAYEQPIYYVRDQPIERIVIMKPFNLLIADTGQTALTKEAVGDVRQRYQDKPDEVGEIFNVIGTIARKAKVAIETGNVDLLGTLMTNNHELLQKLTVSSSELDTLVDAAMRAGALGAKLSGGGRGGNMIALVEETATDPVQQALVRSGAKRIVTTKVT